jgi:hypothetical protein
MLGFLKVLMLAGWFLSVCAIVSSVISAGLFTFKKTTAAKYLIKTAGVLVIVGFLCLVVVLVLGGVGAVNA